MAIGAQINAVVIFDKEHELPVSTPQECALPRACLRAVTGELGD
jgi:hypothetical protein